MRTLLIALILGCLAPLGWSQTQCSNTRACSTDCVAMTGSCCVLEETAPSSSTPLGYIPYTLPGTDSDLPFPCVRIVFPSSAVTRNNYLVVAAETPGTSLCIRQAGMATPTCGNGGVFFCMNVNLNGNMFIDIDLVCEGVGPSCEAADSTFFIRSSISTFDSDVENFCDVNGTLPLPSSLAAPTDIPNMPMTRMPVTEGGATPLQSLSLAVLTVISALASSWVWSH